MPFPRPLGMSTKKAPPAGAPFVLPQLGDTGQEQCKSEPFVKNKGRVSSWRWYPAFGAISACSFMGECGILGLVQQTGIYLLTLLTFPYFQGFPPLKILYMYPFPLFLPLWDNYKGKFIIQLFNRCLPLYQEVLRKSALLPL